MQAVLLASVLVLQGQAVREETLVSPRLEQLVADLEGELSLASLALAAREGLVPDEVVEIYHSEDLPPAYGEPLAKGDLKSLALHWDRRLEAFPGELLKEFSRLSGEEVMWKHLARFASEQVRSLPDEDIAAIDWPRLMNLSWIEAKPVKATAWYRYEMLLYERELAKGTTISIVPASGNLLGALVIWAYLQDPRAWPDPEQKANFITRLLTWGVRDVVAREFVRVATEPAALCGKCVTWARGLPLRFRGKLGFTPGHHTLVLSWLEEHKNSSALLREATEKGDEATVRRSAELLPWLMRMEHRIRLELFPPSDVISGWEIIADEWPTWEFISHAWNHIEDLIGGRASNPDYLRLAELLKKGDLTPEEEAELRRLQKQLSDAWVEEERTLAPLHRLMVTKLGRDWPAAIGLLEGLEKFYDQARQMGLLRLVDDSEFVAPAWVVMWDNNTDQILEYLQKGENLLGIKAAIAAAQSNDMEECAARLLELAKKSEDLRQHVMLRPHILPLDEAAQLFDHDIERYDPRNPDLLLGSTLILGLVELGNKYPHDPWLIDAKVRFVKKLAQEKGAAKKRYLGRLVNSLPADAWQRLVSEKALPPALVALRN
ncbi:MAG: hypothetical protein AB1486_09275 [Planctomycetota bacterium]